MWFDESILYHIYPLGFCGAPKTNTGEAAQRLDKIKAWIPHMTKLGADALYLGPVFESDAHGYDTRDYGKIDVRLGDKAAFADLCGALHGAGVRVVLDGVFNHVGRGFWAFRDVRENKQSSPYKDWFRIDFGRDSNYGDGFWYEGWEGHFELVKLNLQNPAVVDHLLECVGGWIDDYGIDGLRLDVAYSLDREFMRRLRSFTKGKRPDFFLLGECLHGDYNQFVAPDLLDSCTNYECYKGLYSSFNELNMHEIGYSLNRQFGPEHWTIYKGKHLVTFVDNHDVTRIASILKEQGHLPLIYGLMFAMPGIPCLYYGSEWGQEGKKEQGDDALRPALERPVENGLFRFVADLCAAYKSCKSLAYGGYQQVQVTNSQLVFRRQFEGESVICAVNAAASPCKVETGVHGPVVELVTGKAETLSGSAELPAMSIRLWRVGAEPVRRPDPAQRTNPVRQTASVRQAAPAQQADPAGKPVVERLRPEDLASYKELMNSCFGGDSGLDQYRKYDPNHPAYRVFVVKDGGAVVGACTRCAIAPFTFDFRPGLVLLHLAVRPDSRGRDMAKALVDHIVAGAKAEGYSAVSAICPDSAPAAQGLCADMGFERTGAGYFRVNL